MRAQLRIGRALLAHNCAPRARSQAIRAQLVRVTAQLEQEQQAAADQKAELITALHAHQAAAASDMERQHARQAAMLAARDEAYSESLRRNAETAAEQLQSQATAHEAALAKAQAGLEREQQLREKDAEVRPSPPIPPIPPLRSSPCGILTSLHATGCTQAHRTAEARARKKGVNSARSGERGV